VTRAKQQTLNERLKCSNKEEIYSRLHDKVQSIGYKTETDDIYICYFLIEEECQEQYYQNYIGIPTYSSTRDTQEVKSSNYIS